MKMTLKEKLEEFKLAGKGVFIIAFIEYFPKNTQQRILKVKAENLRYIDYQDLFEICKLNWKDQLPELVMMGIDWSGDDIEQNYIYPTWSQIYLKLKNLLNEHDNIKYLI